MTDVLLYNSICPMCAYIGNFNQLALFSQVQNCLQVQSKLMTQKLMAYAEKRWEKLKLRTSL